MLSKIFQIEIPRRSSSCYCGGEPLSSGMEYYSLLIHNEGGAYERRDYCLLCWEKFKQDQPKGQSFWKSVVPIKKELSDLPKQRDVRALELLKEALNHQEEEALIEAFILALYLARRRLLILRQEVMPNLSTALYEIIETEEMLCIPKFDLTKLPVEKIQEKLAKKFQGR